MGLGPFITVSHNAMRGDVALSHDEKAGVRALSQYPMLRPGSWEGPHERNFKSCYEFSTFYKAFQKLGRYFIKLPFCLELTVAPLQCVLSYLTT